MGKIRLITVGICGFETQERASMSTTQETAAEARADPSGTLRTSASIYFPILGAALLLFELLRRCCRRAYDSRGIERDAVLSSRVSASRAIKRPFGWVGVAWKVTDDEILERCGLDTLSFLRFLRLGRKLALLAVVLSAALFPLYATASSPSATDPPTDPLTRISMSNVPSRSARLWASTAAAYLVTLYALYLMLQEYKHYVARRHDVLGRPDAQQYSVLLNDLPPNLRTKAALETYVGKIFPNTVRDVYVALECSAVETYVEERKVIRNKLEHALATYDETSERPQHREGRSWVGMLLCRRGSCGRMVDSIAAYQHRLDELNELVRREIESIEEAQELVAMRFQEQHGSARSGRGVNTGESNEMNNAYYLHGSDYDEDEEDDFGESNEKDEEDDQAWRREERILSQDERNSARKENPMRVMRRAAFVSFSSLKSAQVAQQSLQASNPVRLAVSAAPHIDDVKWENIGHSYRTRAVGRLISALISAAIVLFWTIPTAFVASLSTVESIRHYLPFLRHAFDKYPVLQDVVKQLAPLALVAFSALAPLVFSLLSAREGHSSQTEVRASLFTKLAYFQLVQIFFVTVIVGTILDSIKEILDQPKMIISMLGRSMPQQSTFFMSYVIIQTGLSLSLELLRVVPLVLSTLFIMLAPKRTRRERESPWMGLRYIASTDPFDPTKPLADAFLVVLVTFTFAAIAPLVCYFTAWFFFIAEMVYRRQVLYVYQPTKFALGAYWPRLYRFLIIALVVSQLTMLGLLSLKKAAVQSILIAVLIIVTLLFHYYVARLYPRVAKYLPLTDCVRLDTVRGRRDANAMLYFLDAVYRQPAMTQRDPVRADYRVIGDRDNDNDTTSSDEHQDEKEDAKLFERDRP